MVEDLEEEAVALEVAVEVAVVALVVAVVVVEAVAEGEDEAVVVEEEKKNGFLPRNLGD